LRFWSVNAAAVSGGSRLAIWLTARGLSDVIRNRG
jgi:hypothetical protein